MPGEPASGRRPCPVALLYGPGHRIVHGNPAFLAAFGKECLGLPAAEALVDVSPEAFDVIDLVYRRGRPLACWVTSGGEAQRLTVAPRRELGSADVYGVAIRLAPGAGSS